MLGKKKVEIGPCKKVPSDMLYNMDQGLKLIVENMKENQENRAESSFVQVEEETTGSGSVIAGKEAKWRADMALARCFYDSCISINSANLI